MPAKTAPSGSTHRIQLSLDTWSVLAAFALAALVRFGILKHIPW
jgi:hypothetical protein